MPSTTVQWNVDAGGDWDTVADWSNDQLPNSSDDVVISTAHFQTITHNAGDDTVHSLTVGDDHFVFNGGSLALLAGASFAMDYQQFGGVLLGAGAVTIADNGLLLGGAAQGTLAFSIGGTISLSNYTLGGATTLTNNATTNQTGGIKIGDSTGVHATITNSSSGAYTINGDFGIAQGAATAKFVNAGSLQKTAGSGTSFISVSVADTGTISVASGILEFAGPTNFYTGAISGAGTFAVGGGGTHLIGAGTTITTAGFDVYDAGTVVTLGENLSFLGTFNQGFGSDIILNGHTLTPAPALASAGAGRRRPAGGP